MAGVPEAGGASGRGWTLVGEGFRLPAGLALDRQDNLYIADSGSGRVVQLSPDGQPLRIWGAVRGRGALRHPAGVALDPQGRLYVADTANERVAVFAQSGALLASWALLGWVAELLAIHFIPLGGHAWPYGVVIAPDGRVVVAVTAQGRLDVFSPAGARLATWGRYGGAPGEFRSPTDLAFDRQGSLYVADQDNDRIQKLAPDGQPLACWGTHGWRPGQFHSPAGIAVGSAGDVYVADAQNHRVQRLSSNGVALTTWGAVRTGPAGPYGVAGRGLGEFTHPTGVAVDDRDTLYVADSHNHRIQKLVRHGDR
jgi:tripartite motif-containing protein 71